MENMSWENEMFECYEKAIETCKGIIDEKNEIIKDLQEDLNYYKKGIEMYEKYEKTQEEIEKRDEEIGFYAVEDFIWSMPKPLQWIVKPWFDKRYKVEE